MIAYLGPMVDLYAQRKGGRVANLEGTISGDHPFWELQTDAGPVMLVRGYLGGPAAVLLADELFRHGVKECIGVGSCGALAPLNEGEWIVPSRALRDEGASYHYLPPSRWVDLDAKMTERCASTVQSRGFSVLSTSVWTTDAILRETPDLIEARRQEGCAAVDMECASVAACAQSQGVAFGQLFYTADSLADAEYDPRGWGVASREIALELALDAITA